MADNGNFINHLRVQYFVIAHLEVNLTKPPHQDKSSQLILSFDGLSAPSGIIPMGLSCSLRPRWGLAPAAETGSAKTQPISRPCQVMSINQIANPFWFTP
jgi:hypothetical protein